MATSTAAAASSSSSSNNILARRMINIVKHKLEAHKASSSRNEQEETNNKDIQEWLSCLDKINVTAALLRETSIDITVHRLMRQQQQRQHNNSSAAATASCQHAKALLKKWRHIRLQEQQHAQQAVGAERPSVEQNHNPDAEEQKQQAPDDGSSSSPSSSASSSSSLPTSPRQHQLQCTGLAAERLTKFRQRVHELALEGQPKPDMVAYKEFRRHAYDNLQPPLPHHGLVEGVPIGLPLAGRGEAAILGLHSRILAGIDALKDQSCFAVCISGGYADEDDHADGTVLYTGSGGQSKKGRKRQVEDQTENTDNLSLIRSIATQKPIRLLRRAMNETGVGGRPMYYYEGLYRCINYTYEQSTDGPFVYKFSLVPIPGQSKQSTHVANKAAAAGSAARRNNKRKRSGNNSNASARTVLRDAVNAGGGGGARERLLSSRHERQSHAEERQMKRQRRDSTRPFAE